MMEQVPTPALSELPGYPRLVDALLAVRATEYSPIAAHVCATAAGWVYAEHPGAVATEMVRRLGLEGVRCEEIVLHNDVMLVASTAILLQSACGRLGILCYRGTEPRNLMNWKVDFNVQPMFVPMRAGDAGEEAMVHLGFHRNLHATWHEVRRALGRALEGQSVDGRADGRLRPMEALYVTGHSLGAAMAALAGVYLATDAVESKHFRRKLRGIYTFGQPMVGNPEFAAVCDDDPLLRDGVFRHVYRHDVVPHLPGLPYGRFAHFGRELRVRSGPGWHEHPRNAAQAPDIILSMFVVPVLGYWATQLGTMRKLARLGYSWYDHLPHFYIEASAPRCSR